MERLRVSDEIRIFECVLVLEEHAVHLPELALGAGGLRRLRSVHRVRMHLREREVAEDEPQARSHPPAHALHPKNHLHINTGTHGAGESAARISFQPREYRPSRRREWRPRCRPERYGSLSRCRVRSDSPIHRSHSMGNADRNGPGHADRRTRMTKCPRISFPRTPPVRARRPGSDPFGKLQNQDFVFNYGSPCLPRGECRRLP